LSSVAYGFSAYAPDGKLAYDKTIDLPDASQPVVRDVDFDLDGNAAVGATALGGPSGFLQGILLLDRTGRQIGFIDTGRYVPAHIAIASDRSIWTLGWQQDAVRPPYPDRQDHMVVRHFSADGKEVNACLPRSAFPAGLEPGTSGPGAHIEVTRDRLGLLAYSGKTGGNAEWVELDPDGNLLDRSRVDSVVRNVAVAAFTADDHVYLEGYNGVYTLDPASHTWKAIQKQGARLMGADGKRLVYTKSSGAGPIQLEWFNQPQVSERPIESVHAQKPGKGSSLPWKLYACENKRCRRRPLSAKPTPPVKVRNCGLGWSRLTARAEAAQAKRPTPQGL
jgi:hypothetical protein